MKRAFITPEGIDEINRVSMLPPAQAAKASGRPVAVIGPRPHMDPDPCLWLYWFQPDGRVDTFGCENLPGAWAGLSALAVEIDERVIIRQAWRTTRAA